MPKKSSYVDFKAVKAAITMEQVLDHYNLLDTFTRKDDNLSGPCPIHKGTNRTQFRVSISKNLWNCFSECKHGGNTLDFIARMEGVEILKAARKAIDWFGLDADSMSADVPTDDSGAEAPKDASRPKPAVQPAPESSAPNKPLNFRLDKLDRNHAYLIERGLDQRTISDFGVGFCAKGLMAGRIAIPIHNPQGEVVAYAGRCLGEATKDIPKYKLPPGFRKSQELFNLDRAVKEPAERPLIIVEGFFDCMNLHKHGWSKVVALMGSTMSSDQRRLIIQHFKENSHVIVMLDEDHAGKEGRVDIAVCLSSHCFVKVHEFDEPNAQPEHLSAQDLAEIMEGVQ